MTVFDRVRPATIDGKQVLVRIGWPEQVLRLARGAVARVVRRRRRRAEQLIIFSERFRRQQTRAGFVLARTKPTEP